jgi:Domain of unknown function (DUF4340)
MRSLGFTVILALLAVLVCGLAVWQWLEGSFDSLLGAPPTPVGQRLYTEFTPAEVKYIQVSQNGVSASFELGPEGWQATSPWHDRMDPRAAVGIINFTLGLRVEDFAGRDEVDPQKAGLGDQEINIKLEGENQTPLARYKIGRRTPWQATIQDAPDPVPTVFIHARDANRKRHIYTCTGDISPLFKDRLKFLRDHHPLYFNPTALQRIRIQAEQGELTLARENPTSPWRVVKPMNLATDPKAMKALLEGLYELQAAKVSDRASVTLPTHGSLTNSRKISLLSFGREIETVLDIFPPETPESRDVRATVSDRPDAVLELPLKPEANLVSLADLPLAINDLRDSTLTNLNIASIRGILIAPSTGAEILISRTPPQPWMATIAGQAQQANEERLFTLLKTVTEGRAIGFETDAATDFTPWGLDQPILKIHFLGEDDQGLELSFGIDGKGGNFVHRTGSPTVMRIDEALRAAIPVRAYEWRQSRLWSLAQTNLIAIERKLANQAPLTLRYGMDGEWSASRGEQDITSALVPARANYLLESLQSLKVARWLASDDASATATPGANPGFYYGRLGMDANPFLLDRDTYDKLVTEVLEK